MRETASERLVRQAARDVALEAMRRISARLREAEANPQAVRFYEPMGDGGEKLADGTDAGAKFESVFAGRFETGRGRV